MKPTINDIKNVINYLGEKIPKNGSFEDVIKYVNNIENEAPSVTNLKDFFVQQSNETKNTEEQIINEIVEAFSAYVSSGKVDESIKKALDTEAKQKRKIKKIIEFWPYESGCSTTRFTGFGFEWTNPDTEQYTYKSRYYKNIGLETIAERVIRKMCHIVDVYLGQQGFCVTFNIRDKRIGIEREIIISW